MTGAADDNNNNNNNNDSKPAAQKKRRAQPGDFEKQVERIRQDIDTIRSNLAAAEKALDVTGVPYNAPAQEEHNKHNASASQPQT